MSQMSNEPNANLEEALSALMDGECTEWEMRRLLKELDSNPALLESWHLSHLAADALRPVSAQSGAGQLASPHFSDRVAQAIAEESAPRRSLSGVLKPLSQLTVAASVAALALIGMQQLPMQGETQTAAAEAQVAQSRTTYQPVTIPEGFEMPALQAQTVSANNIVRLNSAPTQESIDTAIFDTQILDQHIEAAFGNHVEGAAAATESVFPYVRFIQSGAQ